MSTFACQKAFKIIVADGHETCTDWTTDTALPDGIDGFSYYEQVVYNAAKPNLTYSITDGALPAGATLSSAGLLSGIPTEVGAFNFEITATDGQCVLCEKWFSLIIEPQDIDCGWTEDFDIPGDSPVAFYCSTNKTGLRVEAATATTPGACPEMGDSQTVYGVVSYSRNFTYGTPKNFYIRIKGNLEAFAGTSCGSPIGNGQIQVTQTNLSGLPAVLLDRLHSVDGNGEPDYTYYGTLTAGQICTITVFAGLFNSIADNPTMAMVEIVIVAEDIIPP